MHIDSCLLSDESASRKRIRRTLSGLSKGVLFTYHRVLLADLRRGFRINSKMTALEGSSANWGATGRDRDSILRRMVALRVPRGVEDDSAMDAQWFEHLRASATAMEPPREEPTTGKSMGPRGLCMWMQNDLCGKRLVENFLKCGADTPTDQEAGFLHHRFVLVLVVR